MRRFAAIADGITTRVETFKVASLLVILAMGCGAAFGADRPTLKTRAFDWLQWKSALPFVDLVISPMQPTDWLDEKYQYAPTVYGPSTHSPTNTICWPDMKVCSSSDQVLCEVDVLDTPEAQVGSAKAVKTQQCISQENLTRLEKGEDFLRGKITYRKGARP
ncbi:hypothetical protein [Microvirga guangxiensis]|uniref:hypothetical protein n=1 Tax=Microvirga guangxiensis TaxID=549386 RepID=UPI000B885B94|nr:hypothetical protein [Microvirga guangxiensis]